MAQDPNQNQDQNFAYGQDPYAPQPEATSPDSSYGYDVGVSGDPYATSFDPNSAFAPDPQNSFSNPSFDTSQDTFGTANSSDQFAQNAAPADTYASGYTDNSFDPIPPTPATQPNTFDEEKSGSRLFLIGSIVLVIILVIATGVLVYFNFFAGSNTPDTSNDDQTAVVDNNNTDTTDETDDTSEDETDDSSEDDIIVDSASTGGADTPASQARNNNATEIPSDWLLQNFTLGDIDADGNCLTVSKCGEQADPDDDGASNIIEFNFDLDPQNNDTDRDSIADGDELFVYYTNPLSAQSDDDDFPDNTEIAACFDPNSISTNKMTSQRRSQIASNVALRPLREPTIQYLRDSGASQSDILNRGLITSACPDGTTTPVESGTTNTDS